MSNDPQDTQQQQQPESSSAGTQNTEPMIPKSRFDEVNNKYRTLMSEIESLKSEQQKRREEELAEQNRFQELYQDAQRKLEEYKSIQDVATRYEVALKETNLARIQSIPEDKRSLVPEFNDPTQLATWLDKNMPLLVDTKLVAPKLDGGAGGGGGSETSAMKLTEQEKALAMAAGISLEDYAKRKAARGQPLDLQQHNRSQP